jgi:hypothetical protein
MRERFVMAGLAVVLTMVTLGAAQTTDFGRMFPNLPAFQPANQLLVDLALAMKDPNLPVNDNPNGTPSGFTYLGQFLDHDLTLDATPLGDANIDIGAMVNSRTARLDLDSMYGGGQVGSPQLYNGAKFKFESPNGFLDFQRTSSGRAVLVEGRNDENLVIAQLHIAFQRFHNAWIDQGLSFSNAQKAVRWHWQWIVVHEFLPHIVGQDVVDSLIRFNGAGKPSFAGNFYNYGDKTRPMMPIEFSVAAYRFGHSMVRLAYVMPTGSITKTQVFNTAVPVADLRGSRPIPPNLKIDFNNFFDIPGFGIPAGRNISRKIDALISASLYNLPIGPVVPQDSPAVISLAERNLLRSKRLGLPAYQDVAVAMGLTPLTNAQLDPTGTFGLANAGWGNKAPLWFGILKESEVTDNGTRLGPTGGRIVAETIIGIIDADKDSYFHSSQAWSPAGGSFGIADLLLFAEVVP